MKLHLPKNLMAALVLAYAISAGSAVALDYNANTTKYNIGTGESNTNLVNPTVGESGVVIGDGVTVGTYADNKLIVDGIGSTTTPCTNNLTVQKTVKKSIFGYTYTETETGNLTINGTGQVAVGGKSSDGSKYASLTADNITVSGNEDVLNLKASVVHANSLVVNSGNVEIHTGSSDFSQGNSFLASPLSGETDKQARIEDSIAIKGGSLVIGSTSGAYVTTQAHYVMGFGFDSLTGIGAKSTTITQTGGDMRVYGDSIARVGFTIDQQGTNESTMYFSDNLAITNTGTVTIKQSNDNAELIIGRIVNDADTNSGTINVNLTQSGAGDIQLASGTSFSGAKGNVNITQSGGGNIIIGGGINQEKVGVLNIEASRASFTSAGTTYNLTQSESGGTITLKNGAAITAAQVSQTTGSAILNVESGAKLTATTMSTKGTVKNYGTIDTKDLTVSGKYLINYGDIAVSGTLKLEGGQLQTNAAGATTHSSITAANVVMGEGTYFHHDNATIQIDKLTATESEIRVRQDESSLVIGKEGVDTVHEVSNTTIITSGTSRQQSDALTLYVHGTLKGDNNTIYGSAVIDRVEGSGFKFQDQGFNNSQLKVGSIAGGYIDVLNQKGGVEIGTIVSNDASSVSAIKAYQIGDVVVDSIDDKGQMELYAATGNVTVNGAATAATLNIAAGAEVSIGGALNVGTADIESYNGGITLNGGVADTLSLKAATGKYSYLYGETQVGDLNVDGGHFQVKSSTGKLNAENIQLDNAGAYALFDGSTTAENIISNGANVYSRVNTLTVNDTLQLNGGSLTVSNDGTLNAGHLELNGVSSVYVTNGALHVDKLSSTTGLQVTASGAGSELVIGKQGESEIHEANDAWFYLSDGVTLQVNGTLKGDSIQVNGAASIDQVEGNAFYLSNLTEQNVSIGMIKGDNANIGNRNGNVEIGKLETNSNDSRSYISARETGDVSIGSIQDSGSVSVTAHGGNISVTGDVSSADLYITASKDVSIGGTLNAEKALLSAGGTMDLNGGTVGELHLTANSTDTVITLNTNEDLNVLGSLNLGNGYGLELDFELNSLDDNGAIIMGDGADLIFAKELTEASVSLSLSDVAKQIMLDGSSLDLDTETVFTFTLISNLGEQDVEELTQAINGKLVLNSDELVLTIPNAVDFEHSLLLVQNGELRVEGNSLVVDVVTQTVPEPTTATLSLLALAALAARRRRR